MLNQSVRSATMYPDIKFYNCSINMSYSSVCNYYARMYEAKFLMGAIAVALSREDKLGYILRRRPTYGMLADINAFCTGGKNGQSMWKSIWSGQEERRINIQKIFCMNREFIIFPAMI